MDRKEARWLLNQVEAYMAMPSRLQVLKTYVEGAEVEFQAEPGEPWGHVGSPGFYWDFGDYRVVPEGVYYNRYYSKDGKIYTDETFCFKTEEEASDYGRARLHVIETSYESFTTHKKVKNK